MLKVAAAVDACEAVIAEAIASGVSLLLVHHGLFWSGVQPLVGPVRRKIKAARAEELGVNVFYAGHYATETFGVKALAAHMAAKFRVPWEFIDHPTGL